MTVDSTGPDAPGQTVATHAAGLDGHLCLVGMMGAGKTSVGTLLAGDLGRPFVDVDSVIEQSTGHSIPDLFVIEGEAGFRDLEQRALGQLLQVEEPLVIATGGGAVLRWGNREAMRSAGRVVWLRARVDTLLARVGTGDGRPLLGDDPEVALEELLADRRSRYAAAAHHIVDVDERTLDEVVLAVLEVLGEAPDQHGLRDPAG
jgi:shikimate kinase